MKRILLTNDDGFESSGLLALKDALKNLAHIMIVAPANEKSACGHGLTLTRPLHFVQIDDDFYKLEDGTPSDCVYLALNTLYKEGYKPDLVISGINLGSNMGEDITYSGTIAGAMEACIQGVPSIAISQVIQDMNRSKHLDFSLAKTCIVNIVKMIFDKGFPLGERKLLNINVPYIKPKECKGYKITQMGYRIYADEAHLHRNPRGQEYYWLGLHPLQWEERSDTPYTNGSDFKAINENYISITPIKLDMTSYEDSTKLSSWIQTIN